MYITILIMLGVTSAYSATTHTYAGISYSRSTQNVAVGKSNVRFQDAYQISNNRCGQTDCSVVIGVRDGWLAVYHAKFFRQFGFAGHTNREVAEAKAKMLCEKASGQLCEVETVTCSWEDCKKPNPHPVTVPKPSKNLFASIAYSPKDGRIGYCNNIEGLEKASSCALYKCGPNCTLFALSEFCVSHVTRDAFIDVKGWFRQRSNCFSNGYGPDDAREYATGICEQFGHYARHEFTLCTENVIP